MGKIELQGSVNLFLNLSELSKLQFKCRSKIIHVGTYLKKNHQNEGADMTHELNKTRENEGVSKKHRPLCYDEKKKIFVPEISAK